MKLHELKNVKGAIHRKRRVGTGEGNGHGKTSGRGGKGQTARSGGGIRIGFEGGQMPLYRRLPIRGFNQARFRVEPAVLNVGDLIKLDESVTEVDSVGLSVAGIIRKDETYVKVLGDGEITRAIKITASKFSAAAKAKIEAAGGEAIVA
ncbi:MAG: 50S ribosomal protein L15 [Opitutaceae bacterium]|tara:strand:+ start:675 stop:1121 length:447 start_codon:yes stop_codon:yes gene_type:complete